MFNRLIGAWLFNKWFSNCTWFQLLVIYILLVLEYGNYINSDSKCWWCIFPLKKKGIFMFAIWYNWGKGINSFYKQLGTLAFNKVYSSGNNLVFLLVTILSCECGVQVSTSAGYARLTAVLRFIVMKEHVSQCNIVACLDHNGALWQRAISHNRQATWWQ